MGLYRTKPEEVEAIQYTGSMGQPFEKDVPAWVWSAMSVGNLTFKGHGLEIAYNGLSEQVLPSDWLVLHSDGIIRCCNDGVFRTYYTPYKQRRTKAEIEQERIEKAQAEMKAAKGDEAAAVGGVGAVTTVTAGDQWEADLMAAVGGAAA